jgi:hypothetical protein
VIRSGSLRLCGEPPKRNQFAAISREAPAKLVWRLVRELINPSRTAEGLGRQRNVALLGVKID